MAFEDPNRNPAQPALVKPTPEGGGNPASGEIPAPPPVQNPAFRGPPPAAGAHPAGFGAHQPVEDQRRRSNEPPPIVTAPSQAHTPPSTATPANAPEAPAVSQASPNPRRGRFNQTLALMDYQKVPSSPVPAMPPSGAPPQGLQPAGGPAFQPATVGEAVLRQAPGTELGGGDPNATAAVAAVPPELANYLEEQRRQIEARAAQAAQGNVAPVPGALPPGSTNAGVGAAPGQAPGAYPQYVAPPPMAQAAPSMGQPSVAQPSVGQPSVAQAAPSVAQAAPSVAQPAFVQPKQAGYEPLAAAYNPPPLAANPHPIPSPPQAFVSPIPSQPPPGTPWQRGSADANFERNLASLPGPRPPGQKTRSIPSPVSSPAPAEPMIAIKWAALTAIATFVVGVMVGMALYSVL